jgi:hypothetical protein
LHQNLTSGDPRAGLPLGVRFPGEDGGRSLAEMAQRDLDSTLQLLAERAQFITGASGVAIALRRTGQSDMLCRASTGSNAPELGTLLSTEFGLSGESVRTRVPQRCDDAGRDPRVNQEVCRQLGIASVVVMPVATDDEVLGVFELFSGTANAFGERDLSAVLRLSQMVETAVRLARAAQVSSNQFDPIKHPLPGLAAPADDDLLDVVEMIEMHAVEIPTADVGPLLAPQGLSPQPTSQQAFPDKKASEQKPSLQKLSEPRFSDPRLPEARPVEPRPSGQRPSERILSEQKRIEPPTVAASMAMPEPVLVPAVPSLGEGPGASEWNISGKKKLFWSAALSVAADDAQADTDESHVPPVLRGLRKCDACGFPVSPGRALCVECEEKKWRGQVKRP